MKIKAFFLSLFVILLALGCNDGNAQLGGNVTFDDGAPVTFGAVVFVRGNDFQSVGDIDAQGNYKMTSGDKNGLPPGRYQVFLGGVEVTNPDDPMGPRIPLIDKKYGMAETSGLEFTVKEGKNEPFNIKVERNPDAPK